MNMISLADPLSKSLEDKNTIKEKGQELKTHFTWTGNIEWVARTKDRTRREGSETFSYN